ncbi:HAD family hydrolase [Mesorhizobium sp. BR1-1-16]|uniref:HAD family hydrolase n=1 Tax=Mesorhizobium sp. BR1-1-16 TaxID=2876653 RepID=UPI001CCCC9FD|nr:HAD family hydrolase [Mesorhizobium sp. BR1-1-16]MBZ9937759.1 HAD family hydrolase [Mesorhizobium sp. BR1-1-16]
MARLKALLFDKDGTLVDFAITWNGAATAVLATLAGDDDEMHRALATILHYDRVTAAILPTSPFVGGTVPDIAAHFAPVVGIEADDHEGFIEHLSRLFNEGALESVAPIGDPLGLLTSLKSQGYLLGIVTNDTESGARAQSEKLGLDGLFDAIIGYDSGHGRKPDPGQIHAFIDRFGSAPEETALIGDTLHDLDAARAAGVLAIGVASGYLSEEALAPHADHVIKDIMGLPELLDRLSES